MKTEQGSSQTLLSLLLGVAALVALVVFFGPESPSPENDSAGNTAATTPPKPISETTSRESSDKSLAVEDDLQGFPSTAEVEVGSAQNPPPNLPEDMKRALENNNRELPPDMQAQLNAAPPELPEDLKQQLANQPQELPEDLQRQLNSPPPPIPDDIRRALETPPRQVSIDEVNTPPDVR